MKPIKLLITTAFVLLISLTTQAQSSDPDENWAGEDKTVLRLPDSSQTVTIGKPSSGSDVCFEWENDSTIVGDRFKSVITVNPQETVSTYTVHRIDKCGEEIRQIKVTLVDNVRLVSVIPSKCYNHGDTIKLEDFIITTDPPGFEDLVKVKPIIASRPASFATPIGSQILTFSLNQGTPDSTQNVEVTVINDNLTATASVSPDFLNFKETLQKAESLLVEAQKFKAHIIDSLVVGPPCSWEDPGVNFDLTLPHNTAYCCNGVIVDAFNIMMPSISASISYECAFPTSWCIPGIGGLYFTLGFGAGVTVGPFAIRFRGDCSQASVPIDLSAEISGGARVQALSKDLLSFSAKFVGSGKIGTEYIFGQGFEWEGLVVDLSLQAELKTFGLLSVKATYPFGSWTFFK
jgi:hypothetical protein